MSASNALYVKCDGADCPAFAVCPSIANIGVPRLPSGWRYVHAKHEGAGDEHYCSVCADLKGLRG